MDIVRGSVVRAKAGRDKNGYFVVVDIKNGRAFIADGKRRRVESPKPKNLIHLEPVNLITDTNEITNRELRKLLSGFGDKT